MTFQQIQLVKEFYQRGAALPVGGVGKLFYDRLFALAPEVCPLFSRTSLPEQSKKLPATLTTMFRNITTMW